MSESIRHPRPSWVDSDLYPFTSRFIDVDGHRVHYIDEGSGPLLLFLHGTPTWSFLWRDAIRALRSDFRCVALDYPGFGLSDAAPGYRYLPEEHADVLISFIDTLGLRDATLLGQDWGGPIGVSAALRRPGAVTRLVLINTWLWPVNGSLHFAAFSRIVGSTPMQFIVRRTNLIVRGFIPTGHRRRKLDENEMNHYRRALDTAERRQATAILPARVLASKKFFADIEANLHRIAHIPALIVWGDADIAFRANERRRLEKEFVNHRTVIVRGASTYVESDAPDEFIAAVRDWITSTLDPTRESTDRTAGEQ